ncbi:cholesterol 7-desaturase nvd [Hyalella azteca]|uniref:cholesterol 7-desaturase n=1 Tax=Hyalella azteca TaxID=294128 RepID=A0A8B7NUC8_HYAAZ|nr:cholesterol 7-desaturase nvd [Hyalella azteca]
MFLSWLCQDDSVTNVSRALPQVWPGMDTFTIFASHGHNTFTTLMWCGVTILTIVVVQQIWSLLFTPLDRVKRAADVGWSFLINDKNQSFWSKIFGGHRKPRGRDVAASVRRLEQLRRAGSLPPVYPNGWFAVAESRALKPGQVRQVQALGQTLAVYRGAGGAVWALDAHCPHLGADMAVGGAVKGDCLECPFHGWQFRGQDGACTVIPYAKKIPDVAKVRHWETQETNGFVFVWHDAEGRPPQWRVPEVAAVATREWRYRGRTEHEVLAHIQEIPENGADIAHLGHLHVPSVFKGADLFSVFSSNTFLDVAKHEWRGVWSPMEGEDSHVATVNIEHAFNLKPGGLRLFKMTVQALQIGPGLVHLHLNTTLGKGVLVQTVTPLAPLKQKIVHHLYSAPTFVAPFAKFVLHSEACHLERDIMIWNSKQYMSRPLLVAEDKLIKKFRTWYRQFYSPNSPTAESVASSDLDW